MDVIHSFDSPIAKHSLYWLFKKKHFYKRVCVCVCDVNTSMSRQAALRSVIWSAIVSPVKPGTRLANSTILIMHLVANSLNLSQRPKSNRTRWSALEFCTQTHKQTSSLYTSIQSVSKHIFSVEEEYKWKVSITRSCFFSLLSLVHSIFTNSLNLLLRLSWYKTKKYNRCWIYWETKDV